VVNSQKRKSVPLGYTVRKFTAEIILGLNLIKTIDVSVQSIETRIESYADIETGVNELFVRIRDQQTY